jgi:hypothetical protein
MSHTEYSLVDVIRLQPDGWVERKSHANTLIKMGQKIYRLLTNIESYPGQPPPGKVDG